MVEYFFYNTHLNILKEQKNSRNMFSLNNSRNIFLLQNSKNIFENDQQQFFIVICVDQNEDRLFNLKASTT